MGGGVRIIRAVWPMLMVTIRPELCWAVNFYGNLRLAVKIYGNLNVAVCFYGKMRATVNFYGNSGLAVDFYGKMRMAVRFYGKSIPAVIFHRHHNERCDYMGDQDRYLDETYPLVTIFRLGSFLGEVFWREAPPIAHYWGVE
jgi:hypothetical protein